MKANTTRSAVALLMVSLLLGLALPGLALALGSGEVAAAPALADYLPGCSYRMGEDQAAVGTLVGDARGFAASDEAFAPGCGGDAIVAQPAACWLAPNPTVDPVMEFAPGCNY